MRITLGVTGGIAAYKSAELVRRLQDEGHSIQVVMTQGGARIHHAAHLCCAQRATGDHRLIYK